jgi:hypothetical protein
MILRKIYEYSLSFFAKYLYSSLYDNVLLFKSVLRSRIIYMLRFLLSYKMDEEQKFKPVPKN